MSVRDHNAENETPNLSPNINKLTKIKGLTDLGDVRSVLSPPPCVG